MYSRDFKIIVPIASQKILHDTENKMTHHFGGVSVFPIIRGYWLNKKHKLFEDENILMVSSKKYSGKHQIMEHNKDERFMDKLAQDIGQKTHQEAILVEEELIGRIKFVKIHPKHGKNLRKVI